MRTCHQDLTGHQLRICSHGLVNVKISFVGIFAAFELSLKS